MGAAAWAGQPPQLPAPASTPSRLPPPEPSDEPPADDEFIEFLGKDDVGDAAWWEFLKKSAPRKEEPSVPSPQDAKQ